MTHKEILESGDENTYVTIMRSISAVVLFLLSFVISIAVYAPGVIPFFASSHLDSEFINELIASGDQQSADQSFTNTSFIYRYIGAVFDLKVFLILFGIANLWVVYRHISSARQLALAIPWTVVAIILVLTLTGKDVIAVALFGCCTAVICLRRSLTSRILIVALLYLGYAFFIRSYFAFSLALGLGLFACTMLPRKTATAVVFGSFILAMTLGGGVIGEMQNARDDVNQQRIEAGSEDIRSAFMNPLPVTNAPGRVGNFVYAAVRLVVPAFWGKSVKDLLFTGYAVALLGAIWLLLTSSSKSARFTGCLMLGGVLMSIFFEPDVGSYARHTSSMFPFLTVLFQSRPAASAVPPRG